MALPRIEERFGKTWLNPGIRVVAEGDTCEVMYGRQRATFSLSTVTRVMVTKNSGFFKPKDSRTILFLGHTGEIARFDSWQDPTHTQAAATFVRYLIREAKRPSAK